MKVKAHVIASNTENVFLDAKRGSIPSSTAGAVSGSLSDFESLFLQRLTEVAVDMTSSFFQLSLNRFTCPSVVRRSVSF
jgi:orotidine-5'-phosphate decarboxylase